MINQPLMPMSAHRASMPMSALRAPEMMSPPSHPTASVASALRHRRARVALQWDHLLMKLFDHGVHHEVAWRCPLDEQQALHEIREILKAKGGKLDGAPGNYRIRGGNTLVYRLVGSRSRDHQRWMPWRGTIAVDATEGGGSMVGLLVHSAQGFYIYQGDPTRRKWRILFDNLASTFVTATGSTGKIIYQVPGNSRPIPSARTPPKARR